MWVEAIITMFLTSDLVVLMVPTSTLEDIDVHLTMLIFAVQIILRPHLRSPLSTITSLYTDVTLTVNGTFVVDTLYQSLKLMVHKSWINLNFSRFNRRYLQIMALMINDSAHQNSKHLKAVHICSHSVVSL